MVIIYLDNELEKIDSIYNYYIQGHTVQECLTHFSLKIKSYRSLCKILRKHNKKLRTKSEDVILSYKRNRRKYNTVFGSSFWTEDRIKNHSIIMKQVVLDNPDSYSYSNISGRVKIYTINGVKVKGTWELLVAASLNKLNLCWTNKISPLAYCIGKKDLVSVYVNTSGTGKLPDNQIAEIVKKHFPLQPQQIIKKLDLLKPIYKKTACYGHFGRNEFSWEKTDSTKVFNKSIK